MKGILLLRQGPMGGLQICYEDYERIPLCWFKAAMLDKWEGVEQPFDPTDRLKVYYRREGTKYVNLSGDTTVVTFKFEGIFKSDPIGNFR